MEKKIITISREFGSGGRTIGHLVAEKLGIPFYDKELVDQIALESGFAPKYVEEHGEHVNLIFSRLFLKIKILKSLLSMKGLKVFVILLSGDARI